MGQTGADFGAVSTSGLVVRFRRKIQASKDQIDGVRFMTRGAKARSKQPLDAILTIMETEYLLVQAGALPEEPFRQRLIAVLDPGMSGGKRGVWPRW